MTESQCRKIVATRSGGWCEARVEGKCNGRATNKHHRRKHPRTWSPANVLDLCGSGTTGCHGWIEHHPQAARGLGLSLFSREDPVRVPFYGVHEGVRGWWELDDTGAIARALSPVG